MLNALCVGGNGSFGKRPNETVKIFDIQTLCFWLFKGPKKPY